MQPESEKIPRPSGRGVVKLGTAHSREVVSCGRNRRHLCCAATVVAVQRCNEEAVAVAASAGVTELVFRT